MCPFEGHLCGAERLYIEFAHSYKRCLEHIRRETERLTLHREKQSGWLVINEIDGIGFEFQKMLRAVWGKLDGEECMGYRGGKRRRVGKRRRGETHHKYHPNDIPRKGDKWLERM